MVAYHLETYYTTLLTINLTLTLVVMLAACLCCKKRVQKNELLGLEGMVKLKNPDEVIVVTTVGNSESQAELNASTVSNADSEKRSSTAAHRSLPDIPKAEQSGDNCSELYETVADKLLTNAQNKDDKSPAPSLKKQTSVSQHSSISQADDVSSPYSRVKNLPHDYAKVRSAEHPYAQLNAPAANNVASGTLSVSNAIAASSSYCSQHASDILQRSSQMSVDSVQNLSDVAPQAEIPAASAIAGMISASQDLPYMTPPIANQHFSGDSQDSSKGYTSISVREPLANILAQQPVKLVTQRNPALSRDTNDSHYATVSDDSDETYAAIEDPNNRNLGMAADIYTSGSETYAQIQPMQTHPIVVAVEINNSSLQNANLATANAVIGSGYINHIGQSNSSQTANVVLSHRPNSSNNEHAIPIPPPVDSLRAQMHSRQASSSSNNSSSICNLGSPKPEKRQANSPLPPTPKASKSQAQHLHATSSSNLASIRNSVISVIEAAATCNSHDENVVEADNAIETSPQRKQNKSLSPSKDIEGMYAKVMKNKKFSRNSPSSQNNSPILTRKQQDQLLHGISPLDSAAAVLMDAQKLNCTKEKSRVRSNSYSAKDHGYETIPADAMRTTATAASTTTVAIENRKSDCYANILQRERQQESAAQNQLMNAIKPPKHYETIKHPVVNLSRKSATESLLANTRNNDPGYEQLLMPLQPGGSELEEASKKSSDYDPNYEVLKSTAHSDDGYAKVLEKKITNLLDNDTLDGYSKVKGDDDGNEGSGGYSTIPGADANHNYASISETKASLNQEQIHTHAAIYDNESDHYARIADSQQCVSSAATTPTSINSLTVTHLLTSPTSLLNNSSSLNTMTNSTSTLSSRQTLTSSQYESLTGSETDPNYESVCYLNTATTTTTTTTAPTTNSRSENPYERLQTEQSDTTLSSPLTPDESNDAGIDTLKMISGSTSSSEVIVDDYFHI